MNSQFVLCLVLVAGTCAHGLPSMGSMQWPMQGMGNGNNGYQWGGSNNMGGGGYGNMGGNRGNNGGWGQMQMPGGQSNMLEQLLRMHGTSNAQPMPSNMGYGASPGPMGVVMAMALHNILSQNMGGNRGGKGDRDEESTERDQPSREEMRRLEEMMRMDFAMEVAQLVKAHTEYEKKMENFKESIENLCLGVEAAYEFGKRNNVSENATLEGRVEQLGERLEMIDSRDERLNELVKVIGNDEEIFNLGFFKTAMSVCKSAEEYMKAEEMMKRAQKEDGGCDKCNSDSSESEEKDKK